MVMPTDVYNRYLYDGTDGGLKSIYLWEAVYTLLLVYLTIFLPFASYSYQADSDPRITRKSPLRQASVNSFIVALISWAVIGVLYGICHSTPEGPVNFFNFLVAVPGFFGWIIFALFGAVGIAALPISLIYGFIKRPRPMSLQDFEEKKKVLGERAALLRTVGEKLRGQEETLRKSGTAYYGPRQVKFRRSLAKYKQVVSLLSDEHKALVESYKKRGSNPFFAYLKVTVGVVTALLSLVWIFQILWTLILADAVGNHSFYFVSDLLVFAVKSKTLVPDLLIYMALCSYLAIVSTCGMLKISMRLQGWLPVETISRQGTHLDTLLSLLAMVLLMSTAINQLAWSVFPSYAGQSAINTQFTYQSTSMRLFKTFYHRKVFEWIFVVIAVLSAIWFCVFPATKPAVDMNDPKTLVKWAKLQQELGIDSNEPGAVGITEDIVEAANQPAAPTLAERAQARFNRLDEGIESAPNGVMGAGLRAALV